MSKQRTEREEKIQLLKDIATGEANIEDLYPPKIVIHNPGEDTYFIDNTPINREQVDKLRGDKIIVHIHK